ncbi:hypothetical protein FC756_25915 [Lysinibacillus mangiferihumi]|uniref:Uncharacterized protein n=1 Tax=Lysinibacillus mangiferihumi TaxID=1130819 RepID=A0A4U2XYQ0_9BACI|nr:hypothetical protein [Lysinibacillus mangiferihumi]TKI53078.1 hypothetical protein FC756_25915 [Lysinibacillus mangiferihumi]
MFLIVEFKYSTEQEENKVSKFNNPSQIIEFVADKSTEHEAFEVVRINEYKEGKLIPYELVFIKGRIDLVPVVGGIK